MDFTLFAVSSSIVISVDPADSVFGSAVMIAVPSQHACMWHLGANGCWQILGLFLGYPAEKQGSIGRMLQSSAGIMRPKACSIIHVHGRKIYTGSAIYCRLSVRHNTISLLTPGIGNVQVFEKGNFAGLDVDEEERAAFPACGAHGRG